MPSQDQYYSFYTKHVRGLSRLGTQAVGWCPFHKDEGHGQKGFSVKLETGQWYCHSGCGGGNTFIFIEEWNKLSGKPKIDTKTSPDASEVAAPDIPISGGAFSHYYRSLSVNNAAKAVNYLRTRGISDKLIKAMLRKSMFAYEHDRKGAEWIVFPIYNKDGDIMGVNRRWIGGTPFKAKSKNEGNQVGGYWGLPRGERVVATEGVITAMTLMDHGFPAASVISCSNPVDPECFTDAKDFVFGFDRGEEGQVAKAAQFIGYCRAVQWGTIFPHNFDFNDLWVAQLERAGGDAEKAGPGYKATVAEMLDKALPIQTLYTAGEKFPEFERTITTLSERDLLGADSGFTEFNDKCSGIIGVSIIGAPAKCGKSTISMNFVKNQLLKGNPVYMVDHELGFNWIMLRLFSTMVELCEERCIQMYNDPVYAQHRIALKEMTQNLLIEPYPGNLDFFRFESQVRALERKSRKKVELVIVDSIQKCPFIKVGPKVLTDQRQVAEEWMKFFERVKTSLGVNILVISELSREKGEFKETGRIDYACDQAFKLYVKQTSASQYADMYMESSRHTKSRAVARYLMKMDKVSWQENPSDPDFCYAIEEMPLPPGWKKPRKQKTVGEEEVKE